MRGRKQIRDSKAKFPNALSARVTEEEFNRFKALAASQQIQISHWIRKAMHHQYMIDTTFMGTVAFNKKNPMRFPLFQTIAERKKQEKELSDIIGACIIATILLFRK